MAGIGLLHRSRAIVVAGVAAALCGLALGASPAGASRAVRLGAAVVDRVSEAPASVKDYWTRARMRAARPAPMLSRRVASAQRARGARRADARPARTARRRKLATPVREAKRYPNRTHGKVFFTAQGSEYECSGTAVRAPSRNLVLTAGHCTYLLGPLGSENAVHNWIFVPSYDAGRAPFGKWVGSSLATPAGWTNSRPSIGLTGEITGGDSRFDLGAVTVTPHGARTLQAAVGGRKVRFRGPRRHRYDVFGYPAERPYSGQREFACSSPYRGGDLHFGTPPPIKISCDMTAGASGGGWIDQKGRLVSVTSYGYTHHPRSLYGPYFGVALRDFFGSAASGF